MSTGKSRAWRGMLATFLLLGLLAGCSREAVPSGQEAAEQTSSSETQSATGFVTEQVLESDEAPFIIATTCRKHTIQMAVIRLW